jgi:hypothetical protein
MKCLFVKKNDTTPITTSKTQNKNCTIQHTQNHIELKIWDTHFYILILVWVFHIFNILYTSFNEGMTQNITLAHNSGKIISK